MTKLLGEEVGNVEQTEDDKSVSKLSRFFLANHLNLSEKWRTWGIRQVRYRNRIFVWI